MFRFPPGARFEAYESVRLAAQLSDARVSAGVYHARAKTGCKWAAMGWPRWSDDVQGADAGSISAAVVLVRIGLRHALQLLGLQVGERRIRGAFIGCMLPGSGRGFKPMATPNYPAFVCSSSAKGVSADEPAPAGHPAVPSHTRLPSALPILLPIHRRLCVRPPSRTSSEPLQLRHSTTGEPLSATRIGYSRS